ncbi:MAG: tripartite tricarboxylate transporter substrate-binding protein, partial [Actinomadura sp.]
MRTTSRYRAAARMVAASAVVALAAACAGNGGATGGGAGGGYPDKNITIVVPFSAGGPTDTVTRMIAEPMATKLGAKIVVQNVEGAGGTVGAGQVARAEPDGYTVLMHHIGMSTAPALYQDLGYKPLESFETVGLVTEVPMTVVARKDFAPSTLQELVAYVKANAGKVTLANAGIGAASHLCGLLFQTAAGVKLQEVPYEGTGPALTDLVGGQVDF